MAADRNGAIIGYFVNVKNVEKGTKVQLFTSSTNLIVDSLEPFTVYTINIAAQTAVGAGPYSIGLSTMTMEDGKTVIICFNIASFVTGVCKENNIFHKLFQSNEYFLHKQTSFS